MSYFDDNEDAIIYGHLRGHDDPFPEPKEPPTCRRCGKADLKWRINDNDRWQLFEQSREGSVHNRNVPHQCNPTTLDDFDAL